MDLTADTSHSFVSHYASPLGNLTLAAEEDALTGLWFDEQKHFGSTLAANCEEKPLQVFTLTTYWLDEYFAGRTPAFTPPIRFRGSDFRCHVWQLLLQIPYGETRTYGDLAKALSKERGTKYMSAQAIGGAVGHNPVSIIVPCHRVVGSNGTLTGYAAGIERKKALLNLEAAHIIP